MSVSNNNKNRGTHGDSSFMLGGLPSSSENPPSFSRGECQYDEIVSYDDFVKLVEEKQNDPFCRDNPDNFSYSRNVDGYRFTSEEFF